jgi:hypothetical protein
MPSYTSQTPQSTPLKASHASFFQSFYAISDTPAAHEKYVDQFTADAKLIMASKHCSGAGEILALRKGMWEKVESRTHTPTKIFPFGAAADEVMLYGTVAYVMKEGQRKVDVDWAARAQLVEDAGGVVRMSFYQVYLVSFCVGLESGLECTANNIIPGYGGSEMKHISGHALFDAIYVNCSTYRAGAC